MHTPAQEDTQAHAGGVSAASINMVETTKHETETVYEQNPPWSLHLGSSCGDIRTSFLPPSGYYSFSKFNWWTSGCAEEITLSLIGGF